jgi:ribosomal protein S21
MMSKHQRLNGPNDRHSGPKGLGVEVRGNDVAKALRKLKKKLADDGMFQELRQREFFESKGTKRRKEKLAAIRRYKKNSQKDQDI